ncbi:MAG: hypothetical protein R3320_13470, partial [Nitriliruptorales bacterium]|nr:hypothetical protein [Nitriliruptorales bacterium]
MDARRALTAAGVSSTAMVLAALGGATWYYARRITEPPADLWPLDPRPEDLLRIEGAGEGTVTLAGREADRAGVWGLAWEDGYGQVGEIRDTHDPADG